MELTAKERWFNAARAGCWFTAKDLLSKELIESDVTNYQGKNALHIAIEESNYDNSRSLQIEKLLEFDVPVVADKAGRTIFDSLQEKAQYIKSDLKSWIPENAVENFEKQIQILKKHLSDDYTVELSALENELSAMNSAIKKPEKRNEFVKSLTNYLPIDENDKNWFNTLKTTLDDSIYSRYEAEQIHTFCIEVLSIPEIIKHSDWINVVKHLISLSITYSKLTEESYGYSVPVKEIDEDEGGAIDSYFEEHRYTFDYIAELLSREETQQSADWVTLIKFMCKWKRKSIPYYTVADEEVNDILNQEWVQNRSDFTEIKALIEKTF